MNRPHQRKALEEVSGVSQGSMNPVEPKRRICSNLLTNSRPEPKLCQEIFDKYRLADWPLGRRSKGFELQLTPAKACCAGMSTTPNL